MCELALKQVVSFGGYLATLSDDVCSKRVGLSSGVIFHNRHHPLLTLLPHRVVLFISHR
jgi:hypothetical protein